MSGTRITRTCCAGCRRDVQFVERRDLAVLGASCSSRRWTFMLSSASSSLPRNTSPFLSSTATVPLGVASRWGCRPARHCARGFCGHARWTAHPARPRRRWIVQLATRVAAGDGDGEVRRDDEHAAGEFGPEFVLARLAVAVRGSQKLAARRAARAATRAPTARWRRRTPPSASHPHPARARRAQAGRGGARASAVASLRLRSMFGAPQTTSARRSRSRGGAHWMRRSSAQGDAWTPRRAGAAGLRRARRASSRRTPRCAAEPAAPTTPAPTRGRGGERRRRGGGCFDLVRRDQEKCGASRCRAPNSFPARA